MSEAEWEAERWDHDPVWELTRFARTASPRKARLLMCGALRAAGKRWKSVAEREYIELAEQHADGMATVYQLRRARVAVRGTGKGVMGGCASGWTGTGFLTWCALNPDARGGLRKYDGSWHWATADSALFRKGWHWRNIYEAVIRDIFGNPFRPVAFDPAWRTVTAVSLARQMYESRDFGAMPILADALQDAGCDHPDILAHCRDPSGVHVRGCWVVDLVLNKG